MSGEAYYIVFVKPGDTLSGIVRETLGPFRTHQQWMTAVSEVAARSSIRDPDRIFPGQPVILRSPDAESASKTPVTPIKAEEVEQLRSVWNATPKDEREIVEQHWDLLSWVNAGNNGVGGLAGAGVAVAQVELSRLQPPPPKIQIALRQRIQYVSQELIQVRNRTVTILRREGFVRTTRPIIRLVPDTSGQARYATRLRSLTSTARGLRWLGKGSLGLSLGLAGYEIHQDWDTPNRYRTSATQVAGVGAATLGGAAGYLACNVALGFPTGGNSLWICALIAGGAAGAVFGEAGAGAAERAYDLLNHPEPAIPQPGANDGILQRVPLPQLR